MAFEASGSGVRFEQIHEQELCVDLADHFCSHRCPCGQSGLPSPVQMPRGRRTNQADHFPQYPHPPGLATVVPDEAWERRFEHRRHRIATVKRGTEYCFLEARGLIEMAPARPPAGIRTGRWSWHRRYTAWRDGIITLAWCRGFEE